MTEQSQARTKRKKRRARSSKDDGGSGSRVRSLEEQLSAVRDIGEALASSVGLDALFRDIVPNVTKLMHAERTTLFLYDASSDEIWSKVAEGETGREIRLKAGQGIAGWVAKNLETVNVENAYDDPRFHSEVDTRTGFRTHSIAATPLIDKRGALLGVLQCLNHKDGPFSDDDIGLLETIGVQAAYAVENARQAQEILDQNRELEAARNRAERRRAELDLLYELEKETAASDDIDQLLDSVIVRACERLRSEAGSVLLLDQDSGRLFFRGVTGEHADALKRLPLEPGEGVVGWVAERGEAVVVNRPEDDPRHDAELAEQLKYPAEALLAVPLVWDKRVIGAVEVLNPEPRRTGAVGYDLEDLKVLTVIAGQLARAIALTQARQERIETERLAVMGRMLAGVAHDLRNPMTVISGYAQMMAIEDDPDERSQRCERVLNQIDEMTAMVSDLLAFARGDTVLHPALVNLPRIGEELRDTLSMQCEPRGIELDVQSADGEVFVDPSRAKRILYNLARNAVDVLTRGGRLSIRLEAQDGGLTAEVSDTGPGIPSDLQTRLFQPFVTANKPNGTGLGLSIVKRFIEDHRGTIRVESELGKGTRFLVNLPKANDPPVAGG